MIARLGTMESVMHPLRRSGSRCRPGHGLILALGLLRAPLLLAQADTTGSAAALRDYLAACAADGGRLWGKSLCGPLILVDPGSRAALATEQPPGGVFRQVGSVWRGAIPPGIPTANFSLTWAGRPWAMVLLPLPEDRYVRLQLLLHESFHRIQGDLGLAARDAMNPHLDERDGRYWLRLELRAMAGALRAEGDARTRAARDALLFRRVRQAEFSGADTLENQLEQQEGLPEYTGARLALDYLNLPVARAAVGFEAFEGRATFVRALGYGTGPGLGLLLDQYAPGWRSRVSREGFAPQLAGALHFQPPENLTAAAEAAARLYDAESLARAEDERATARGRLLAEYRARLVDGPVLMLRQERLARGFNPNALIAMGAEGTVYPSGTFNAEWGSLEVEEGGALVTPDFSLLRLSAPADTAGRIIQGKGWRLELAEAWRLVPGDRAGDVEAVKGP
jgi:hypothetical protein